MAWTPATPFSKVVATATTNYGKTWRETLGYTSVNVYNSDSSQGVNARKLLTFGQGVIGLTNGVYQETNLTFDVNLDALQY